MVRNHRFNISSVILYPARDPRYGIVLGERPTEGACASYRLWSLVDLTLEFVDNFGWLWFCLVAEEVEQTDDVVMWEVVWLHKIEDI